MTSLYPSGEIYKAENFVFTPISSPTHHHDIHNFLYFLYWDYATFVAQVICVYVNHSLSLQYKTRIQTKRRWSDPVLWQKPLHKQKCQKGKVTTQTTPQKSSIKQQLRTDLGRSVGVTTATQLVLLTWFTGPPSHSTKQPCNEKDTHLKICK